MLATQTAHNSATTMLSHSLKSMISVGGYQYGLNGDGVHALNSGDLDDVLPFESSVTLATTDMGIHNPKRLRYLYFGIDFTEDATVDVQWDEDTVVPYTIPFKKSGLQRVRVPIGSNQQGRYLTITVKSTGQFRLDSISGLVVIRSSGIVGY